MTDDWKVGKLERWKVDDPRDVSFQHSNSPTFSAGRPRPRALTVSRYPAALGARILCRPPGWGPWDRGRRHEQRYDVWSALRDPRRPNAAFSIHRRVSPWRPLHTQSARRFVVARSQDRPVQVRSC